MYQPTNVKKAYQNIWPAQQQERDWWLIFPTPISDRRYKNAMFSCIREFDDTICISLLRLPWGLQTAQKPVYINKIICNLFINIHKNGNFVNFL